MLAATEPSFLSTMHSFVCVLAGLALTCPARRVQTSNGIFIGARTGPEGTAPHDAVASGLLVLKNAMNEELLLKQMTESLELQSEEKKQDATKVLQTALLALNPGGANRNHQSRSGSALDKVLELADSKPGLELTEQISQANDASMVDIDTLIFDIDDTLFPASSGFSDHRNGDVVSAFMVDKLGFASAEEALKLRNEVFQKYHSTLKGLTIATAEGRLPKPFKQEALGDYWAEHCDFEKFLSPMSASFIGNLQALKDAGLNLVAFTNSPRKYALRCLDSLGLRKLFADDCIFAVEDVMPNCKPEAEAFQKVFRSIGTIPEKVLMFEDSMKNVRACKALGMHTVLIDESGGEACLLGGEAALLGDTPDCDDPAVDIAMTHVEQIDLLLPGLLQKQFTPAGSSARKEILDEQEVG